MERRGEREEERGNEFSAGICSNTKIEHSPNYWKQQFLLERCHVCPIEPELSDMYFQSLFTKGDSHVSVTCCLAIAEEMINAKPEYYWRSY